MTKEIKKLALMLIEAEIPFQITKDAEGNEANQIWYPSRGKSVCDAICHRYSYGGDKGLLEIMGLTTYEDDVAGYLTAEEVFKRIAYHYCNH